jgi:hypothetical protein
MDRRSPNCEFILSTYNSSDFSTVHMSVPRSTTTSTSFGTIFNDALETYTKHTKNDITSHPLTVQLKSCDTPSAILDVLRAQVQVLNKSQDAHEKFTTWLVPTVNVLHTFSATLGSVVGLVNFDSSNHLRTTLT